MKNLGNFLVGTLSSFGVAQALPETAQTVANSIEALVSLISGLLSALVVAWLKRRWDKKSDEKAV